MDKIIQASLKKLWSTNRQLQNDTFFAIRRQTDKPVDWARECISEKNYTLIRYDILESMRNVFDEGRDEKIRAKAMELIGTEEDLKYHKKYAGLWKK